MVQSIQIRNFKSIVNLKLELGAFNVLIGENGSGKSNILEAIAFGAAASADKLDSEFFGSRGIRVTSPEFMFSAFKNGVNKKLLEIVYTTDDKLFKNLRFLLSNDSDNPQKWLNESKERLDKEAGDKLAALLFDADDEERSKQLKKVFSEREEYIEGLEKMAKQIRVITKKDGKENESINFFKFIWNQFLNDRYSNKTISDFVIYSPEQSSLRKFEDSNQLYPIGINGEGLFKYLKELASNKKNEKVLNEIKANLLLLDWYENFELPENLVSNEFSLKIKDKYIHPSLQYFDQRSTNEGFLFLLFYSTLFISKLTPVFFAIDNIDASLNPKLCMQLTKNLAALAKKKKKQVIVTTQNPAILDGLNLKDDSQRLFVVRRNEEGHTKIKRVEYKVERKMKLSEVWTSGFIGGLPENF